MALERSAGAVAEMDERKTEEEEVEHTPGNHGRKTLPKGRSEG